MLIDSHSHLNFRAYKNDLEEVLTRALGDNVWCINVGTKYETSRQAVEIAEKYGEGVYASIGMHPIHIKQDLVKFKVDPEEGNFETLGEDFIKDKYLELAKSKKVVAIGEIGLDYYYRPKTKSRLELFKQKQKELFVEQLKLAKELNLPVIIHSRMAHQDLLEILKINTGLRGVLHCFTGTWQEAQEYLAMGFYIGINGIIFKLNLDEVIKNMPLGKILVETDCPYLTPSPAIALAKAGPKAGSKDTRNEPVFVKYVAERIAELKGINYAEVADTTTSNARKLFNI